MLIEAWKKLKREHPELVANKQLAIVGGSAFTDDYVQELHELAKNEPSIVLTGNQTSETLHALFGNAYAFVHPSESEGLPIAILEEMSYGKCVLSSDIPENLELTKEHGLTFKTGDVKDLVKQMKMMQRTPSRSKAVRAGLQPTSPKPTTGKISLRQPRACTSCLWRAELSPSDLKLATHWRGFG